MKQILTTKQPLTKSNGFHVMNYHSYRDGVTNQISEKSLDISIFIIL